MIPNTYAVVSTMKNEGPFILDWVAHYKVLGFDHIVIATNDCTDPTDAILDRMQELGLLLHHNTVVRRAGIQRSAIRQAIARYPTINESEWIFICDADEYLNIHVGDGRIRDLINASGEDFDAIAIPWRVFGPNGIENYDARSITQQFIVGELPYDPKLRPEVGKFTKSIVTNRDKFARMGLHLPVMDKKADNSNINIVLPGGEPYIKAGQFVKPELSFDVAQINHYALRSLKSYLVKRDRGRANHENHVLGVEYFKKFNLPGEIDVSISRYDKDKEMVINMFLEDPILAELQEKAEDWHRRKGEAIAIDPENDELVDELRALNQGNLVET